MFAVELCYGILGLGHNICRVGQASDDWNTGLVSI